MNTIKLCAGQGVRGKSACWMSAIGAWARGEWTGDKAGDCVDESIRALGIAINDTLTQDGRDRLILPRLLDPLGTRDDSAAMRRMYILVDAAVRVWAADALEYAGSATAQELRGLQRIDGQRAASVAAREACDAASCACDTPSGATPGRSASYACDAASCACAARNGDAISACDAAGHARDAAHNAFDANNACVAGPVGDAYIERRVFPVMDALIAAGRHAPTERGCSEAEFFALIGSSRRKNGAGICLGEESE